jgi:hypothetical protein
VLARQRVAQASQAKQCRRQASPQKHNKQFPQYQAVQAGTFEKISCQLQAGQKAAQASQADGAVGLAGLQDQNKRFLVIHSDRVSWSEGVAFFRKNY